MVVIVMKIMNVTSADFRCIDIAIGCVRYEPCELASGILLNVGALPFVRQ